MRKVTKYSCERGAEITLILNEHDKVIGVEAYFEEPIDIVDFRLETVFQPRPLPLRRPLPTNILRTPGRPPQLTQKPCQNCEAKGD